MKKWVSFFWGVCRGYGDVGCVCGGGGDLCLDQNLPMVQQRRHWPFSHFRSRHQCALGAGHEIPYIAKRL